MKISIDQLREMVKQEIDERCQKGYKTHEKRKTKKMYGKTYRNCVKAESMERRTYKIVMYDKDGKERIINVHDTTDEARARQVAANTFVAKSHGWTFNPPAAN